MDEPREHEHATLAALTGALRKLRGVDGTRVEVRHPAEEAPELDAEVRLRLAGGELLLLVEVKKTIFPRDTDRLLWQMNRARNKYAHSYHVPIVPLIAAEAISTGARERLRAENIGFFDAGGSLFLPTPQAYIDIDRPVPKAFEKKLGSIFAGRRAQVLHALLAQHREWLSVASVAESAEVSAGTASETLGELERLGWVSSRGQGPSKQRRLTEPSDLLDAYRQQVLSARRRPSRQRYYVPGGEGMRLAHRVAETCEQSGFTYALTGEVAAQCYASFLTSVSRVVCRMSSQSDAGAMLAALRAKPVSEGANLEIIDTPTRGEMLFRERKDALQLASPVQVYLDLMRSEGRAKEVAEHLRKEVLDY